MKTPYLMYKITKMNFLKSFVLIVLLIMIFVGDSTLFAQNWNVYTSPRYRQIRDLHLHNSENIAIVGGNPSNDAISYMAYSSTGGQTWENFTDVFPGKLIMSVIFNNNLLGFCAGYDGSFLKTMDGGKNWQNISFGVPLNNRNINKLFKGQYGDLYATGGLDGLNGFLLKSNDAGLTWQNIYENSDNEILTAFSSQNNHIVIAGKEGFIQISENGAGTWQNCEYESLTYTPEFTSIYFLDENNGFCCGGLRGADSVSLIMKTTDGGVSWQTMLNTSSPCLNDISMASDSIIYAVGDYGIVLKSVDAGATWQTESITGNPSVHLFTVDFPNTHIGAIGGNYGYVMIYNDGQATLPEAVTLEPNDITSSSATLKALVNPGFSESQVVFLYGTTNDPTTEISLGTFFGGDFQNISYSLSNLLPNTKYYYMTKLNNAYGEYLGDVKSFYTGNPIKNWDFEYWNTKTFNLPNYWNITGNIERTNDGSSNIVSLIPCNENDFYDSKVSAILNCVLNAEVDNNQLLVAQYSGGFPINIKPTFFNCRMNYDIESGDSALVIVSLEKNDVIISENWFYVKGSSDNNFTNRSFELVYQSNEIPDTVMIGFTNSSPFNEAVQFSSYVKIDSIWFDNSEITLPNNRFDNWLQKTIEYPENWYFNKQDFIKYNEEIIIPVSKETDSYFNNYALRLQTKFVANDTILGELKTSKKQISFPVTERHDKLEAYYKYNPELNDTAQIFISLYKNQEYVGGGSVFLTDYSNGWEKASINIVYNDITVIPDSAGISISSTLYGNPKESVLFIDKITFDGDYIPVEENISQNIKLYPNPFSDFIIIEIPDTEISTNFSVRIFDAESRIVYSENLFKKNEIYINTNCFATGLYYIKIYNDLNIYYNKVIKL